MTQASLFSNNRNQAVRIPKALEFPNDVKKVNISIVGNGLLITPSGSTWDSFFLPENRVSDDFMEEREQPADQERESF